MPFPELGDCFGYLAVLQQGLAESQVGTGERRSHRNDLAQLLDLFCRTAARAGAVGCRQIELRLDRRRSQRHRLLEFAYCLLGVRGR